MWAGRQDGQKKKMRAVTRSVTVFRVLPRATNEAPILPCPRAIYIINISFSVLPHSPPSSSPVSPHFTVSFLRDLFSPLLLTLLQTPISVTSVLFRRAQNSSHVRITHPQLVLIHPHFLFRTARFYPCVQLGPSLSLLPLSLFRHSLLRIFARN